MQKLWLLPVLLYIGCVVCGVYGSLHNQISYTISPAFFNNYLFPRHGIPDPLQNRLGAAIVGFHASWWMGMIVGTPILLMGLILPGKRIYFMRCLFAFGLVAATAVSFGMGALAYVSSPDSAYSPFDRAGVMHDFSYLGGFIGIFTGSAFLIVERLRIAFAIRKRSEPSNGNHCTADG